MTTYILAVPPSANALFTNVRGKGRRKTAQYAAWIRGELKALIAQRAKPVGRRAVIKITVPNNKRRDVDSYLKGIIDLLVRAGVLADDRSDYVASVSASFGDVEQCHVSVEAETKPAAAEAA